MATPSEILRKTKKPGDTSQKTRTDKEGDDDNDEKMPAKGRKTNALVDWIGKHKKTSKD